MVPSSIFYLVLFSVNLLFELTYVNYKNGWVNEWKIFAQREQYNNLGSKLRKISLHIESRRGFWENIKGYYYTIRKIITWQLSVVTYRI